MEFWVESNSVRVWVLLMVADGRGLVTCELEDRADCYRRHRQRLAGADVPSTKAILNLQVVLSYNL